ncbi:hypothetical protein GCM10009603_31020 [Nocardiopsis exhalans]
MFSSIEISVGEMLGARSSDAGAGVGDRGMVRPYFLCEPPNGCVAEGFRLYSWLTHGMEREFPRLASNYTELS